MRLGGGSDRRPPARPTAELDACHRLAGSRRSVTRAPSPRPRDRRRRVRYVPAVTVAVPIVAGTAIRGLAATVIMRRVLARHENAFLITLAQFGVTLPLERSRSICIGTSRRGLPRRGATPGTPIVLVGHSQGALACLRYAIDHSDQVLHTVSVGAPWHGSVTAGLVSRAVGLSRINLTPALSDMAIGSPFLTALHDDLPKIADRVTNIYSTHELFIRPYIGAHIDVPGVENLLIATEAEYHKHLRGFPDHPVDDIIMARVTHVGEMSSPDVRGVIWDRVARVSEQLAADDGDHAQTDAVARRADHPGSRSTRDRPPMGWDAERHARLAARPPRPSRVAADGRCRQPLAHTGGAAASGRGAGPGRGGRAESRGHPAPRRRQPRLALSARPRPGRGRAGGRRARRC